MFFPRQIDLHQGKTAVFLIILFFFWFLNKRFILNVIKGFTASPKVDVFSAGLLLLEAFLGFEVWSYLNLQQIFFKIMSFVNHAQHPLDVILRDHSAESRFNCLPECKFLPTFVIPSYLTFYGTLSSCYDS